MNKYTAIDIYNLYNRAAGLISELQNLQNDVRAAADSNPVIVEDLHIAIDAMTAAIETPAQSPTALYKAHRTMYLEDADFNN